jgi:hypothetical protein
MNLCTYTVFWLLAFHSRQMYKQTKAMQGMLVAVMQLCLTGQEDTQLGPCAWVFGLLLCNLAVQAMRLLVLQGLKSYPSLPRPTWVLEWPGQVVLLVAALFWTADMHAALQTKVPGKANLCPEGRRSWRTCGSQRLVDGVPPIAATGLVSTLQQKDVLLTAAFAHRGPHSGFFVTLLHALPAGQGWRTASRCAATIATWFRHAGAVQAMVDKCNAQLGDIISLVRGHLTPLQRCTLSALVVQDVHARCVSGSRSNTCSAGPTTNIPQYWHHL